MGERFMYAPVLLGVMLLVASSGCSDSPEREADAALLEAGASAGPRSVAASDAGAHDAASDATPSDAASADGIRIAHAVARLTQIRPRTTVGLDAPSNDLDAQTAWWPIFGSVSFRTTAEGVDLAVDAHDCRTGYSYPVFIYTGADCSAIKRDSTPWDRGTLKAKALCIGAPGATVHEARANTDPKPWSLGGPAASNLLGRAIAIHDPDTREPLACGIIEAPDGGAAWVALSPDKRPSNAVVQELGGLCIFRAATPPSDAGQACPDQARLSGCVLSHCVAQCLEVCADHIACLERTGEVCTATCDRSPACESCLSLSSPCALAFCASELGCNPPPTPGGPCTQFRACCMRQGPVTEGCLQYAELLERLSGDPSCLGALWDWDVNTNFTYRSPCYPDAGMDPDPASPKQLLKTGLLQL
jgi:hypothetical protein